MKPVNYYLDVLKNYVGFRGRARRAEFWWFTLVTEIIGLLLSVVDDAISDHGIVGDLYTLATLLPGLAVTFRRLHDSDRSAWWILFGIIPIIGWITLIVLLCQDSTPGPNKYGPNPKGVIGPGGPFGYGPYAYGAPGYGVPGYGPYGTGPQPDGSQPDNPPDTAPSPYSG